MFVINQSYHHLQNNRRRQSTARSFTRIACGARGNQFVTFEIRKIHIQTSGKTRTPRTHYLLCTKPLINVQRTTTTTPTKQKMYTKPPRCRLHNPKKLCVLRKGAHTRRRGRAAVCCCSFQTAVVASTTLHRHTHKRRSNPHRCRCDDVVLPGYCLAARHERHEVLSMFFMLLGVCLGRACCFGRTVHNRVMN